MEALLPLLVLSLLLLLLVALLFPVLEGHSFLFCFLCCRSRRGSEDGGGESVGEGSRRSSVGGTNAPPNRVANVSHSPFSTVEGGRIERCKAIAFTFVDTSTGFI